MSGGVQMRIGIDIDDTLTDIKDQLTNKAMEYAKSLGKNTDIKKEIHDIYNNGNIYQQLFGFNYDELKYFLGTLQEEITNQASPRKNCVQVIKNFMKKEMKSILLQLEIVNFTKTLIFKVKLGLIKMIFIMTS